MVKRKEELHSLQNCWNWKLDDEEEQIKMATKWNIRTTAQRMGKVLCD